MTPTKVLFGQSLLVLAIALAGIWGATQWAAFLLGNQPRLGTPWFVIAHYPVFEPFAFFFWWYWFDAYAPDVFAEASAFAACGGIAGVALAITGSIWRAREHKLATTFGSARWANAQDVQAAGLMGNEGVFLGRFRHHYLRHDGPEHVMCFAPTRSGKGVGLVIPTLLTWPHSRRRPRHQGRELGANGRLAGAILALPSVRSDRSAIGPLTTRCSKSAAARMRCATCRTSPTSWSIPKARSSGGTIGRRPPRACWSAPSCMSSMPRPTSRSRGVATFLSDPPRPFERTLRAMMTTNHLGTADAPASIR